MAGARIVGMTGSEEKGNSKEIGEDVEALRINPKGDGETLKAFQEGSDMARCGF